MMFWFILAAINVLTCTMNVHSFIKDGDPSSGAVAVLCGLVALIMGMNAAAEISKEKK